MTCAAIVSTATVVSDALEVVVVVKVATSVAVVVVVVSVVLVLVDVVRVNIDRVSVDESAVVVDKVSSAVFVTALVGEGPTSLEHAEDTDSGSIPVIPVGVAT